MRRWYAACGSRTHGILLKKVCCSRDKDGDESRLPDGNSQNLQPLLVNWKQTVTSPHHSVGLHHSRRPGQKALIPAGSCHALFHTCAFPWCNWMCAWVRSSSSTTPRTPATRARLHTV